MPTPPSDAAILLGCAGLVAAGLTLIALGLILDPPMALVRRLTKEN